MTLSPSKIFFIGAWKLAKPMMTQWTAAMSALSLVHLKVLCAKLIAIFPHDANAFALHGRIGRQERASSLCALNEVGGFAVPSGNVIKFAVFVVIGKSERHILDLRGRAPLMTDKGRVADDVINVGRDGSPVNLESVALVNICVGF